MKQKILFIASILAILFLLFLTTNQKPVAHGKISEIIYSNNKISIYLNNKTEIIVFANKILPLKKGDSIEVFGTRKNLMNKSQIIADKIVLKKIK